MFNGDDSEIKINTYKDVKSMNVLIVSGDMIKLITHLIAISLNKESM